MNSMKTKNKNISAKKSVREKILEFNLTDFVKSPDQNQDNRIAPSDLFSLFTANIIKRRVKFTR